MTTAHAERLRALVLNDEVAVLIGEANILALHQAADDSDELAAIREAVGGEFGEALDVLIDMISEWDGIAATLAVDPTTQEQRDLSAAKSAFDAARLVLTRMWEAKVAECERLKGPGSAHSRLNWIFEEWGKIVGADTLRDAIKSWPAPEVRYLERTRTLKAERDAMARPDPHEQGAEHTYCNLDACDCGCNACATHAYIERHSKAATKGGK